jgi:nucleotide-binding universal stress UspA family protein
VSDRRSIVVGVDGSEGSIAALRWALDEARLRGARLRVVHAVGSALPLGDVGVGHAGIAAPAVLASEDVERLAAAARSEGERVIGASLDAAGATAGDDVERVVVEGPAARVLIETGRGSDLLVVGSRGRGGFAGLLLGSVSQQCVQHPPCPVVVLPPVS